MDRPRHAATVEFQQHQPISEQVSLIQELLDALKDSAKEQGLSFTLHLGYEKNWDRGGTAVFDGAQEPEWQESSWC